MRDERKNPCPINMRRMRANSLICMRYDEVSWQHICIWMGKYADERRLGSAYAFR
jgi:hypothetical protein